MAQYSSKIVKKTQLTADVLELRVEKPTNFTFAAGQFVQFRVPNGDNMVLRSYSIASSPSDPVLLFCIKTYSDGKASTFISQASEGHTVSFQGPNGRFVCGNTSPLVFVATGVGIAPIISILRDELENKRNQQMIHLLFGVRNEPDIFWTTTLDALVKKFPNFTYKLTLSQPETTWTGLAGRVTSHIPEVISNNTHFFLCGSTDMVKDVRSLLTEKSIPSGNIHFEIF